MKEAEPVQAEPARRVEVFADVVFLHFERVGSVRKSKAMSAIASGRFHGGLLSTFQRSSVITGTRLFEYFKVGCSCPMV